MENIFVRATVFALLLFLLLLSLLNAAAASIASFAFLFFIPGFFVVRALRIELEPVALAVVSILASVLFSTQLIYWLSLAVGYSQQTIVFSFFLWSLLAFAVDFKQLSSHSRLATARKSIGEHKYALAGAVIVFLSLFAILSSTLWVETPAGVVVGGYNWADFFVHLSTIQSVNAGNFPVQAPYFAGASLAYHWFVDFHTAIFSSATAIFSPFLVRLENAFYSALLFLSVFCLARFLLRNAQKKNSVALLAAILVVFGGGLGFTQLFGDIASAPSGFGALPSLVASTNYDAHSTQFQVISIMEYLLVQRPQIIALPVLCIFLFLLLEGFPGSRNKLFLAGLILGCLAPFQYAAFAAGFLALLILFFIQLVSGSKRAGLRKQWALFVLLFAPLLLAVPFFVSASGQAKAHLALFWVSQANNPFSFVLFYVLNLGVPFVIAIISFFWLRRSELPEKSFLFLFTAAMFALPNLVSFSAFDWDMGKFFAYLWIPCCIATAFALYKFARAFSKPLFSGAAKLAVLLLVLASIASPMLFLAWFSQSQWIALTTDEAVAGNWMSAHLPERAIVVSYQTQNSPIDLAGRLRLSTAEWIVYSYSLPYAERFVDIKQFYCGSQEDAVGLMQKYNASFVYLGNEEKAKFNACSFSFTSNNRFKQVYNSKTISIYEFK